MASNYEGEETHYSFPFLLVLKETVLGIYPRMQGSATVLSYSNRAGGISP